MWPEDCSKIDKCVTSASSRCQKGRSTVKMSPNTKDKVRREFKGKVSPGLKRVSNNESLTWLCWTWQNNISHDSSSSFAKNWLGKDSIQAAQKSLYSLRKMLKTGVNSVKEWSTKATRMTVHGKSHILFTDESPIELQPKVNLQNRRIRTRDTSSIKPQMRPKFPMKIMVVGEICSYGRTELYVVPNRETVNGQHYRTNILPSYTGLIKEARVFPCSNLSVLIQEGATCHTTQATLHQIQKEGVKVWTD